MDLLEITDNKIKHPWELARKVIVNQLISSVQKENINILDVGSGDAYLADNFTREFPNTQAHCVDTGYTTENVDQIEHNFQNTKLHLYNSLDKVTINAVNVVTLLDVIEHVPDDVALLNAILEKSYINKNSFFLITVPAYQSLFSRHDELLLHYRRYNLQLLHKTAAATNLKVLDSGYFFATLLIPRILQVLTEKFSSKQDKELGNLGTWKGSPFTTSLIKNVLLMDYRISRLFKFLGIKLPGLSCYMLCTCNKV